MPSGDKRVWQLISLKADGVEILAENTVYASTISSDIATINLRYGGNTVGDVAYFDNISVTSYLSEDGISPVPDKYSLLSTMRSVYANAAESLESGVISNSVFERISARVDAALDVFRSAECSAQEYNTAMQSLSGVASMINAYQYMRENGTTYYVDDENAVISGDVLTDSAVTVSVPVYTAAADGKTAIKALGFLYRDEEHLTAPALVAVVPASVEIDPDSDGSISVPFDLAAYVDRTGLSAKVVVLEDYAELTDSVPDILIATKEDAAVGDGYNFVGDISVSKEIVDDGTETEKFKVIYALAGKTGSRVSLLVVKPDADLASISEQPASVIEYYNTAVFDENGKAVFEFIPKSGMNYYDYIVNCDAYAQPYEDKVFYADIGDIDGVFDKMYADQSLGSLSARELDAISVNTPVYSRAVSAGVNIDGVLGETLEEKRYDARRLSEFTTSFMNKLHIVTLFREADSADAILEVIDTYGADITNASKITALSPKKSQEAYAYILQNKNRIEDMASLNDIISDAAAEASQTQAGGGGTTGGGSTVVPPIVASGWADAVADTDPSSNTTVMQDALSMFDDLDSVSWAKTAILEFAVNNWVDGKADGIFAPNDSITREEFVKMAVNVFGFYVEDAECNFTDASPSAWYYPYIASAASTGIVNGIADGAFGIGQTITRQDMAVIIYRIAQTCGLSLTADGEYLPFADETEISDYAFEAVLELTKSGVINGADNNSFLPQGLATRAEAVKMLYEAYRLK